jgi:hypothetical protein
MEFFARRCFFRAIRLWRTSGPQAWLEAEKGLFKVKVGKAKKDFDIFVAGE